MLDKKIPPPLVMMLCALLMWSTTSFNTPIHIDPKLKIVLCTLLLSVGILIDIASLIRFRKQKTTLNPLSPESTASLVVSGCYRISRNPMYLGLALILSAWAIYLAIPLSLLGVVCFVLYITYFQIKPEELALEQIFGDEYKLYKAKVRRWI